MLNCNKNKRTWTDFIFPLPAHKRKLSSVSRSQVRDAQKFSRQAARLRSNAEGGPSAAANTTQEKQPKSQFPSFRVHPEVGSLVLESPHKFLHTIRPETTLPVSDTCRHLREGFTEVTLTQLLFPKKTRHYAHGCMSHSSLSHFIHSLVKRTNTGTGSRDDQDFAARGRPRHHVIAGGMRTGNAASTDAERATLWRPAKSSFPSQIFREDSSGTRFQSGAKNSANKPNGKTGAGRKRDKLSANKVTSLV